MVEVRITDNLGKARPGVNIHCRNCNIEFTTYSAPSKRAKYCSIICANKDVDPPIELKCNFCAKQFLRYKSNLKNSKSGLRFCSKKCKGVAQRIGGLKEIMPPHYGTAKGDQTSAHNYYRKLFTNEFKCYRCGYDEFTCAVEVHHKDKNRKNNTKENLIPLCANCHRGLHNNLWKLDA